MDQESFTFNLQFKDKLDPKFPSILRMEAVNGTKRRRGLWATAPHALLMEKVTRFRKQKEPTTSLKQ